MMKKRRVGGFTLSEVLLAVAIIAVLVSLAIVGLFSYMRGMKQVELDAAAKEIYIAAQNHLSSAEGQGYLGKTVFGNQEAGDEYEGCEWTATGAYFFVVEEGTVKSEEEEFSIDEDTCVLSMILPSGAIDPSLRTSGSYIIRYDRGSAEMLDVFYCETGGRFGHTIQKSEYMLLMNDFRGAEHKSDRKNYPADNSVIGYYGGNEASDIELSETIQKPRVTVENNDTLTLHVSDPNIELCSLTLYITGDKSGNTREVYLKDSNGNIAFAGGEGSLITTDNAGNFTVVLDDITKPGASFGRQFCTGDEALIPGENITVRCIAASVNNPDIKAESAGVCTSSLFAGEGAEINEDNTLTAGISYLRHLENLSPDVSGMSVLKAKKAVQLNDIKKTGTVFTSKAKVYSSSGSALTAEGDFYPVRLASAIEYNGNSFMISGLSMSSAGDAGLFSSLLSGSKVYNLELCSFDVRSENASAGALAGKAENTDVTGVLVHNTPLSDDRTLEIYGYTHSGGLIGDIHNSAVYSSAAAVYVKAENGNAGGLIGNASGGNKLTDSYSGGHVLNGCFRDILTPDDESRVNVISLGGISGGLIGVSETDLETDFCYSTASVYGFGGAAGFIGKIQGSGNTVDTCYSTGLVLPNRSTLGAGYFIASYENTVFEGENRYLDGISPEAHATAVYGVTPISVKDAVISGFIVPEESRSEAKMHDMTLYIKFDGKFTFPTAEMLHPECAHKTKGITDIHNGDWQIPDSDALPLNIYNFDTLRAEIEVTPGINYITVTLTGADSGNTEVLGIAIDWTGGTASLAKKGIVEYYEDEGGKTVGRFVLENIEGTDSTGLIPLSLVRKETTDGEKYYVTITLDDITLRNHHFTEHFPTLEPGENFDMRASSKSANWQEMSTQGAVRENSLFSLAVGTIGDANIMCNRHLQNLDPSVSGVSEKVTDAILLNSVEYHGKKPEDAADDDTFWYETIFSCDGSRSFEGGFYGIHNDALKDFDGLENTLSNYIFSSASVLSDASGEGNAALFRMVDGEISIHDLLIDGAEAEGTNCAGALIGEVGENGKCTIDTVLALPGGTSERQIRSSGSGVSGGLAGKNSGEITLLNSASSLAVSGGSAAGGLIGQSSGVLSSENCYVGGHTENGKYVLDSAGKANVYSESGTAGGLIGKAEGGNTNISNTFSAASVSGSVYAGGVIGSLSGSASLNTVYTVAPVFGAESGTAGCGTFAGKISGTSSAENCSYLTEIYSSSAPVKVVCEGSPAGIAEEYYEDRENGNTASAMHHGESMQNLTHPFDSFLKGNEQSGTGEYPFSVWTSFDFAGSKGSLQSEGAYNGTYYGDWQPSGSKPTEEYSVTFLMNDPYTGSSASLSSELASQVIIKDRDNTYLLPYVPARPGYRINYWVLDETEITLNEDPAGSGYLTLPAQYADRNRTLTAVFREETTEYYVRFFYDDNPDDENVSFTQIGDTHTYAAGSTSFADVKVPSRTIAGYSFAGWYYDTDFKKPIDFSSGAKVGASFDAYAKYEKIEYYYVNITFMYQYAGVEEAEHLNSVPRYRIDDERSQYTIKAVKGTGVDTDVVIPGFEVGNADSEITADYFSDQNKEGTITLSGDKTKVHINASDTAHFAVTFKVNTALDDDNAYEYRIVYRLSDSDNSENYVKGGTGYIYRYGATTYFTAPIGTVPDLVLESKSGFDLVTDGSSLKVENDPDVQGKKVIYIDYERKQYNLTFDTKGGVLDYSRFSTGNRLSYGQNFSSYIPTTAKVGDVEGIYRNGYTFKGWSYVRLDTGKTFTGTVMPSANIKATASWEAKDVSYTLVYWREQADHDPEMQCTLAEHTHSDSCYSRICSASEEHTHTDACYTSLKCTKTVHTHIPWNDGHNAEWNLENTCYGPCTKEEHQHTDACYQTTTVPHVHDGVTCKYTKCGLSEHTHSRSCYSKASSTKATSSNYSTGRPTNPANGTMYARKKSAISLTTYRSIYLFGEWYVYNGNEGTGTYQISPDCGKTEHTHSNTCCSTGPTTTTVLVCTKEVHTHTSECCKLNCRIQEHQHSIQAGCYNLGCGKTEHLHTEACYQLSCTLSEHKHTGNCYSGFDYWGMETKTAKAGSTVSAPLDQSFKPNLTEKDYFTIWDYGVAEKNRLSDYSVEVKGDGTTIVNVFFRRNTYTFTFKEGSSTAAIYSAKYGADISSWWPIKGNQGKYTTTVYDSEKKYTRWTPGTNKQGWSSVMVYVDRMVGENVTFTYSSGSGKNNQVMHFCVPVLPGDTGGDTMRNASTADKNVKYIMDYRKAEARYSYITMDVDFISIQGFTQYKLTYDSKTPITYASNSTSQSASNYQYYMYYTRNSYKLSVYNKDTGVTSQVTTFLYEQPVTRPATVPAAAVPSGAYNDGFNLQDLDANGNQIYYADQACTVPYTFSETMPAHDLMLYVKFNHPTHTVSFDISDPAPDEGQPAAYKASYSGERVFTVEERSSLDDVLSDSKGDLIPAFTPEKSGWTFDGWFYQSGGKEYPYVPAMSIREDMQIYAKWEIQTDDPSEIQYRDITIECRYIDDDGKDTLLRTEKREGLLVDTTEAIFAPAFDDYYAENPVWYHTVTDSLDQVIKLYYRKVKPWMYTAKYYIVFDNLIPTDKAVSGLSGSQYTLSSEKATYLAKVEENKNAYNRFETVEFTLPEGFENYHLINVKYDGKESASTTTVITPNGSNTALVEYYLMPDPTTVSIEDIYKIYSGEHAPDVVPVTSSVLQSPTGISVKFLDIFRYFDSSKHPLSSDNVLHTGLYRMNRYLIAEVTGTPVGASSSSVRYWLVAQAADETLNLRIGPREVEIRSAGASKKYDGTPLTAEGMGNITVSGDGFIGNEGVDIAFTVEAFRLNPGKTENSFTYEFKSNTDPNDYIVKTKFGTLTVTE